MIWGILIRYAMFVQESNLPCFGSRVLYKERWLTGVTEYLQSVKIIVDMTNKIREFPGKWFDVVLDTDTRSIDSTGDRTQVTCTDFAQFNNIA